MSDLPRTRAEALSLGLLYYFTGKPCKHGHIAKRQAWKGNCVECERERKRKWKAENADKERERQRKWKAANREKLREASRKHYAANRERVLEDQRQWCEANPEKKREIMRNWRAANRERVREQSRQWHAENRDKCNAVGATRRARKLTATPPWADMAAIKAIYAECARVTAETGVAHHVDHIVPLKGRNACGLHVENNLQVLTASENIKKGNRLPHDRRCCPA